MSEQGRKPLIDASFEQQELFPIREVSRLTGVNAVTLRAWERRYGLIQPIRTDSGHRLYSQADINEIRRILGWLERGVAISKVGSILARGDALSGQAGGAVDACLRWQNQIRLAVQHFDVAGLNRLYDEVFAASTLDQVFADVFMPVWHDMVVRQGGYGQPLQELALVCERLKPDALVLFSHQSPTAELARHFKRLASMLECPLLLAGEAAEAVQDNLAGSPVACLGAQGSVMRQRLRQFLARQLDT